MGMALWTPKARASYEHAETTPRPPRSPPTITGRPRSSGRRACSTEAKKASISRCRIARCDTNICSYLTPPRDGWSIVTGGRSGGARTLVAAAPHVDRVHPRPGCTLERAGDAADAHVAPAPAEDDRAMIRRPHPGREDGLRRAEAAPAPADHLGDGPGTTAAHR